MIAAEEDGYLTGLSDIVQGRWDGDGVIPPSQYMNREKEWHSGYERAYQERMRESFHHLNPRNR